MNNKEFSKIKYYDVWGLRKDKYNFLESHDVKNTKWQELELKEPRYFFVPKDLTGEKKYNRFLSVKDIFYYFQAGVTTGQDKLFVDMNYQSLQIRMLQIFNKSANNEELKLLFKLDSQAGKKLLENRDKINFKETLLKSYSYRVFDIRYFYPENKFLWRSVEKLQQQFSKENIVMVTTKSLSTNLFRHIFITKNIGDYSFISDKTREVNYYFPLYLYESNQKFIFKGQKRLDIDGVQKKLGESQENKRPNIKKEIFDLLGDKYKKAITPEGIFYYIYAVLYSNIYRKKYNEFLKIDFPKIPFTKDEKMFFKMSAFGKELVNLHLLKLPKLEKPIAKFSVTGDSQVKKREYQEKEKRIYINDKQYFEKIEPEVWNYYIGGYQVMDKWLKDRIGSALSPKDVNHYLKVITALKYTIDLQEQIDKIYSSIEGKLIEE